MYDANRPYISNDTNFSIHRNNDLIYSAIQFHNVISISIGCDSTVE